MDSHFDPNIDPSYLNHLTQDLCEHRDSLDQPVPNLESPISSPPVTHRPPNPKGGAPPPPIHHGLEERMIGWYLRDHPHTIGHGGQILRCTSGVWQVVPPDHFRDEVHRLVETARVKGEIHSRLVQRLPRPLAERLRTRLAVLAQSFGRLFRHVCIVPFSDLPAAQRDPSLNARLAAEGPGLLNWALAGLQRLVARGRFAPPPAVVAATAAFRYDKDLPTQFIEDRYARSPEGRVPAGQLNAAFSKWCVADGLPRAVNALLARDWVRLGLELRLSQGRYSWFGLKLRSTLPPSPNSSDRR